MALSPALSLPVSPWLSYSIKAKMAKILKKKTPWYFFGILLWCTQTNLHNKHTYTHSVSPCWVNKHCYLLKRLVFNRSGGNATKIWICLFTPTCCACSENSHSHTHNSPMLSWGPKPDVYLWVCGVCLWEQRSKIDVGTGQRETHCIEFPHCVN